MFHHITVLKQEALSGLKIRPDGIYVDCTVGGAGHSEVIAKQLGPNGLLIGFDQDERALEHAKQRLAPYADRTKLIRTNFRYIEQALREALATPINETPQVDGILFDLGVSSPQLDEAERGFSYQEDAPLDMRMDQRQALDARTIVNEWDEAEIAKILYEYGEEKFSRRIAREFVNARAKAPIETTGQLVELIKLGIPAAARRSGPHPAKRTFQAIRIAVNDELNVFADAVEQAIRCTRTGGRVCVITFHSLEDRICKNTFAAHVGRCTCPPGFPQCVCNSVGDLHLVSRKPIPPSEEELEQNNRARSAKLRVAEKL